MPKPSIEKTERWMRVLRVLRDGKEALRGDVCKRVLNLPNDVVCATLGRLEIEGYVTCRKEVPKGLKQARRYYAITEKGAAFLAEQESGT